MYIDEDQIVINVIIAECEDLDPRQLKDKNLLWFFKFKLQAKDKNVHHIKVETFENDIQRKLYAQWNRLFIINSTLYRTWTIKTNGSNKLIFQFIVPQGQAIQDILYTAHDKLTTGGHLGINKVKHKIQQRFYWPGWSQDIIDYVTIKQSKYCYKFANK
jgi:hypothetical protein